MKTNTHILVAAVLALTLVGAKDANALVTTYTSSGTFAANVAPGSYTEGFQSLSIVSSTPGPLNYASAGFSYTATTTTTKFFGAGPSGNHWLSTNTAADTITITFTSGNVTAIGGYFFGSNASGGLDAHATDVTLNDGTVVNLGALTNTTSFAGFTSDVPITSLSVVMPNNTGTPRYFWPTVNDLTVGISSAPVPEPTGWLGVLAVLAFFFGGRWVHARRA